MLEREPECHTNLSSIVNDGDFIKLQCNINFTGSWLPVLQCFIESRGGQNQTLILGLKSRIVLLQCVIRSVRSEDTGGGGLDLPKFLNQDTIRGTFICQCCDIPNTPPTEHAPNSKFVASAVSEILREFQNIKSKSRHPGHAPLT